MEDDGNTLNFDKLVESEVLNGSLEPSAYEHIDEIMHSLKKDKTSKFEKF